MSESKSHASERLHREVGDEFFKSVVRPVSRLYIETDALFDYHLGAILSFIDTEAAFTYIKTRIPAYNAARDRHHANHFPVLKLTEEQVEERRVSPDHHPKLVFGSPGRSIHTELLEILLWLQKHNRALGVDKLTHIHFFTRDFILPPFTAFRLAAHVRTRFPEIKVSFHIGRMQDQSLDFVQSFDFFLLRDFSQVLVHPACIPWFRDKDVFGDKLIFSFPYFDDDCLARPDEVPDLEHNQECYLKVLCDFSYIEREVQL